MRPSDQQLEALADFLAQNPGIARGCLRTAHGRRQVKVKWTAFARRANSLGGAEKDRRGWAKFWADKKCSLKKAFTKREDGGPPDFLGERSPIERRLVEVMGTEQRLIVGDLDALPSTSNINDQSPPVLKPESPVSTGDCSETFTPSLARERSLHLPQQRGQEDSSVLDQIMNSFAEIERSRVAAELTTATALSRAVEQMSNVPTAIEGLSKATRDGAQLVADALNRVAEALGK